MIKEPKDVHLTTTGRQLTDAEFAKISEWIKRQKQPSAKAKQRGRKEKTIAK